MDYELINWEASPRRVVVQTTAENEIDSNCGKTLERKLNTREGEYGKIW